MSAVTSEQLAIVTGNNGRLVVLRIKRLGQQSLALRPALGLPFNGNG